MRTAQICSFASFIGLSTVAIPTMSTTTEAPILRADLPFPDPDLPPSELRPEIDSADIITIV
jgi:hypothetical protein